MAAVRVCCQPFLATLPWYLWTDAIAGAVRIELFGTNHQLRPRKKLSRNERATESPQLTKEAFQLARYSPAKTRAGTVPRKSRVLDRMIFQKPFPLQQYLPRVGEPPLAKQYALPHGCEGLQHQVPCQSMTGRRAFQVTVYFRQQLVMAGAFGSN
jgi:hypothetical protein